MQLGQTFKNSSCKKWNKLSCFPNLYKSLIYAKTIPGFVHIIPEWIFGFEEQEPKMQKSGNGALTSPEFRYWP